VIEVAFFESGATGAEICDLPAISSKARANFPTGNPVGKNAKLALSRSRDTAGSMDSHLKR
jgi:hypothetical protein